MSADRKKWPIMVQIGLLGLPNRLSAWVFFWLTLILTAACIAYGFIKPWAFSGVFLVFAALWYYLSIRWVDQHGGW